MRCMWPCLSPFSKHATLEERERKRFLAFHKCLPSILWVGGAPGNNRTGATRPFFYFIFAFFVLSCESNEIDNQSIDHGIRKLKKKSCKEGGKRSLLEQVSDLHNLRSSITFHLRGPRCAYLPFGLNLVWWLDGHAWVCPNGMGARRPSL